jgi:hypothetical protein
LYEKSPAKTFYVPRKDIVTLLCINTSGSGQEHSFFYYICHSGGKRLSPRSTLK